MRIRRLVLTFAMLGLLTGAAPALGSPAPALWLGNYNGGSNGIQEFRPSELLRSGTPTPTVIDTGSLEIDGIAFDKEHNLWAVANGTEIVEFSRAQLAQLASNSAPTPAAVIASSSFGGNILGCAFDKKGNLWVADDNLGVFEISAKQLKAGTNAALRPAVTLTVSAFQEVYFLAFDHSGNLWGSDAAGAVYELTKRQIRSTSSVTPAVTITAPTFQEPGQLVFDKGGNLWIADHKAENLQKFTKKSIKQSGSPPPAVTITNNSGSIVGPWGMTIDPSANLWVSNYGETISKFDPAQVKSTDSPTAAVFLDDPGNTEPSQMTFGPAF